MKVVTGTTPFGSTRLPRDGPIGLRGRGRNLVNGAVLGLRQSGPISQNLPGGPKFRRMESPLGPRWGLSEHFAEGRIVKTYSPKPAELTRDWLVIEAEGLVIGWVGDRQRL